MNIRRKWLLEVGDVHVLALNTWMCWVWCLYFFFFRIRIVFHQNQTNNKTNEKTSQPKFRSLITKYLFLIIILNSSEANTHKRLWIHCLFSLGEEKCLLPQGKKSVILCSFQKRGHTFSYWFYFLFGSKIMWEEAVSIPGDKPRH